MTEGSTSQAMLKSFAERISRLEDEKKQAADDIKDVYTEAKSNGFDGPALREAISLYRLSPEDRAKKLEHHAIVDTYTVQLGLAL